MKNQKKTPTKPQFYNIIYKLTTFFKKITEKKSPSNEAVFKSQKGNAC
jgi:hypothetical protein